MRSAGEGGMLNFPLLGGLVQPPETAGLTSQEGQLLEMA